MSSAIFDAAHALPSRSLARPRRRAWQAQDFKVRNSPGRSPSFITYIAVFAAFVAYAVVYGT
jgi:hypothetical protein